MPTSAHTIVLGHLGYSLDSLRNLPPYARDDDPVHPEVREWCLEAFYMHARVVADFFVKMPNMDYTARSYLPGWTLSDDEARTILDHAWLVASKQVAHLSRQRVMGEDDLPEKTDHEGLALITEAAAEAAYQFVSDYRRRFPRKTDADVLLPVWRTLSSRAHVL